MVENGSPAQRAGLKTGDVILKVEDQPIDHSNQLSSYISRQSPGEESKLTIWRGKQEQQLDVRIAELKEREPKRLRPSQDMKDEANSGARLGLSVRPLTPDERKTLATEGNIVVGKVSGGAARAGIQPGDVVIGINEKSVKTVNDLREASKQLGAGDSAALLIERQGARIYVPVRVG
jgi:serine protease Do